jgi:hypothetical protein
MEKPSSLIAFACTAAAFVSLACGPGAGGPPPHDGPPDGAPGPDGPRGDGPPGHGPGGHGPHEPPKEAVEACAGKAEGDACTVSRGEESHDGTCHKPPQGEALACAPADGKGGPPPKP